VAKKSLTPKAIRAKRRPAETFLLGDGEMASLMRTFDFSKTPLGPAADWPQSLRSAASICLNSRFPIVLYWGPQFISLYNDAYAPILGTKHPWALGKPFEVVWADIWDVLGPVLKEVQSTGVPSWAEDQLLFMQRSGYPEETYFTFSFGVGRDEQGGVGGIFCAVTETTQRVLLERRLLILKELSAEAKTVHEAAELTAKVLDHTSDVPFALIYLLDRANDRATLASSCGLHVKDSAAVPSSIHLNADDQPWPLSLAMQSGGMEVVTGLDRRFGHLPGGPWPEPATSAAVLPLRKAGQQEAAGFLVLGISPRRAFDEAYVRFFELVGSRVATMIANARAYEEETRRAEALAELDRAKTTFFSNVSHEFRTPLTLMLDPLEEVLKDPVWKQVPEHKVRIEFAYRNSRRLLKLVNSLLDFARIEGGRIEASYEPTDLAEMTSDLAGVFRSAVQQAQLTLDVDCPPLSQPVYVDRDMWEKIVLNLLSNAFKFTFTGGISVSIREESDPSPSVVLRVQDTGTGIPLEQLGKIFERFHRVQEARGRSIEGTGIGLALVKQLIQLHGGTIDVASAINRGSTFTVRLPLGSAHLPHDRIRVARHLASTATRAEVFVEEALRSLPSAGHDGDVATPEKTDERTSSAPAPRLRLLVADDNADMRSYVCRLLGDRYQVTGVEDGQAALDSIVADPPDLVLADVMMPRLDGFGLVQALRSHPEARTIPVILLSARAGEESRIEGLERGADDYLIKPFSAKELLARVAAHLDIARVRRETELALRESETRFRHMADHAPVMVWVTEPDASCSFLSKSWYDFTGQKPDRGLGFGWVEAVHPDDREQARARFLAANERKESFHLEYRLRRRDGEYRWAIDTASPRFGDQGEFLGYIGSVIDITDRRRNEALLGTLLNQSPLGVYLVDADFCIVHVNPIALPVFGDMADLVGRNFDEVVHLIWEKNHADELVMIFRHTLETGEPHIATERIQRRLDGGAIESYEWRIDRIVLPDGRFGAVCYFRDVSVQVLAREALRRSEERLREFAAQLEQLVAERTQELMQSQARLRALAAELNLAEQRERKRLATELHDHLQQMLVLGKLKLGQGIRIPDTAPRVIEIMKQTDDVLAEALQYTRTLVAELSPPILHEQGLAAGLIWLATQMKRHDLTVTVQVPEREIPLPEDQAVLLFQSGSNNGTTASASRSGTTGWASRWPTWLRRGTRLRAPLCRPSSDCSASVNA